MPIYTKSQTDLLTDLVNEANPGLNLAPVSVANSRIGIPWARLPLPGEIGDTSVEIFPRDTSFFIGRAIVHYRRIRLERLFANKTIRFDRWRGRSLNREDLAKWLNRTYQTTFVPEDFVGGPWASSKDPVTINVHPDALCYRGSFQLVWDEGKRELDQILYTDNQDEKGHFDYRDQIHYWNRYHGAEAGVVDEDDSRPLMTHVGFGIDYSSFYDTLIDFNNGVTIDGNLARLRSILQRFESITGIELDIEKPHTEVGGLGGLRLNRGQLPNGSVEEANASEFFHVTYITAEENSWFGGRILFHYNQETVRLPFEEIQFVELQQFDFANFKILRADEARHWRLEEVNFNGPYPETVRQLGITGSFSIGPSYATLVEPLFFDYNTEITEDLWVRMIVREGTSNGRVSSRTKPFLLKQWTGAQLKATHGVVEYDDVNPINVTGVPYSDGTVLTWEVVPMDGDFIEAHSGTVAVTTGTVDFNVVIPLSEYFGTVSRYQCRLLHTDGSVLVESEIVDIAEVEVTTESVKYNNSFDLTLLAGTAFIAEIAGGGGGGSGHATTTLGTGITTAGVSGGRGQLITVTGSTATEQLLSGIIPIGGSRAPSSYTSGYNADHTVLRLEGTQVGRALGGEGGQVWKSTTGSGTTWYPSRAGADRQPAGGGVGGTGAIRFQSISSATNGQKGWIELKLVRKV